MEKTKRILRTIKEVLMEKKDLNYEEIRLKKALVKRELNNLYIDNEKAKDDKDRVVISKISELHYLINAITIDADKTILGSEPALKATYSEDEQLVLKAKLFELVKKL